MDLGLAARIAGLPRSIPELMLFALLKLMTERAARDGFFQCRDPLELRSRRIVP